MRSFLISNFISVLINTILFFILLIGIQNNHEKKFIKLFFIETASLPLGFIVGTSFIMGSFYGTFISSILEIDKHKKNKL